MKVLFTANHFNTGGITSYVMTLARALVRRGHQVLVASSGGNMVPALEAAGGRHFPFAFNIKCDVHPRLFMLGGKLAALARQENADIIHAQTRVTQMSSALASRLAGTPYVSTCHGFFTPHIGRRLMPLWGEAAIAISPAVRDHLTRDLHVPAQRIALIPNGIDLEMFVPPADAARREMRRTQGAAEGPVAGIIARLSDVKGHQYLIDAWPLVLAKVPAAKCLIFGDGPMEDALKARVRDKGLEGKVLFYPVVNRTAEVLPLLDVFVMPSLQEGLGLSVLEAAAMGVPAVVTRVGGLPDTVMEGETGLVVPSADPQALAGALAALLSDLPRARAMGRAARAFVSARFSAGPMADATLAVYGDVLKHTRH